MDTERKLYRWSSEHFICLFYVMCPGDIVYTLPPLKNMTRLAYVKRPSQRMVKYGIYSWISICVEIIKWSTKSIGRFRWYNIMFDHITLQQVFRSFTVDISFTFGYFQHHFIWQPYKSFLWAFLLQLCLLILDIQANFGIPDHKRTRTYS